MQRWKLVSVAKLEYREIGTHKIGESTVVAYVLPKTKTWAKEEHEEIIEDTLDSLEKIIKSSQRVTLKRLLKAVKE